MHAAERLAEQIASAVTRESPPQRVHDAVPEVELAARDERQVRTSLRLSGLPTRETLERPDDSGGEDSRGRELRLRCALPIDRPPPSRCALATAYDRRAENRTNRHVSKLLRDCGFSGTGSRARRAARLMLRRER